MSPDGGHIEGMLLKIQVEGWRMDQSGKGFKPLIAGPDWAVSPRLADEEVPLLASLREDLRRLKALRGLAEVVS